MNLLSSVPLWLGGLILFGLGLAACEAGRWVRRSLDTRSPEKPAHKDDKSDTEGFIIGAVFGLFAFIVGFTFSIAIERFETRRDLVADEANAIRTSYMGAGLFDDGDRIPLQLVLTAYAHSRIAPDGLPDIRRSKQFALSQMLRDRLRTTARRSTYPYRGTDLGVSVQESVAQVLSVGTQREFAGTQHIPNRIMGALLFYLLVSGASLGYLTADQSYRRRLASVLLLILMSTTIVLILDLDRPRSGAIRISQEPLETLVADLDRWQAQPLSPAAR